MIIIKRVSFIPIFLFFIGCMQPNEESLWTVSEEMIFSTRGFCRDVSVNDNFAYVAAGQSGVQIWDLNSGELVHEFLGYSQDGSYLEFDDIALVKRDAINELIFVTESNKKVKIFHFGSDSQFTYRNEIMSDKTKDFISFDLSGDRFVMFVADNDDGLKWGTYRSDTTNVFNLEIINWMPSSGGEVLTDGKPLGVDSDGVSRVAMAVDQLGVEFYDFDTLGTEPTLSSRYDLEGNAEQVELTDIGAFVSCDDFGAYFLSNNYINSGQGSIIHFAQDLTVDHISVQNNIVVLSIGSKGIALYDISDPQNPEQRGIFDVGYVYRSQFWNNKLLLCTRSGLKALTINL
jgi:WD40 repeat protein